MMAAGVERNRQVVVWKPFRRPVEVFWTIQRFSAVVLDGEFESQPPEGIQVRGCSLKVKW